MRRKKPLWPVYEFRPTPGFFRGEFRRYDDGRWTPDDGAYDLAFIGKAESGQHWTYPCCLYFETPYQRNIVCSWRGDYRDEALSQHPRRNPWHYALRGQTREWGGAWDGRDRHPNELAGRAGMSKMSSEQGCCNGRSIEFHIDDPHIAAGLLREKETGQVFQWPQGMVCMYCKSPARAARAAREEKP